MSSDAAGGGLHFRAAADELAGLLARSAESLAPGVERLGALLIDCWREGGKALIAGNGGSAADSMHFAEELVVRFRKNRQALGALALCDPTVLTCAGNDFGFESVFSRQVEALGRPGDVLIVLSTSGNSANLVRAAAAAHAGRLRTAALLGGDGGRLRGACDVELVVPSDSTARVQEVHKVIYHAVCDWVDAQFPAIDVSAPPTPALPADQARSEPA